MTEQAGRSRRVPAGLEIAAVFAGGAIGALLRTGVFELIPHEPGAWPWATLVANLTGTAVLAWLFFHLHHGLPVGARRRRLLEPGLCGALTTFSALQLELLQMLQTGHELQALAYAAVTVGAGFLIALAGVALTRSRRQTGAIA